MTETDRTGSGWRARWARRENARRRRAHEDAFEAWCLRGIRLQRLRAAAEDVPTVAHADLPVELADDEAVVTVLPGTGLIDVEAGRHSGLPGPELSVLPVERTKPAPRSPQGLRVADAGTAVVTDRRVILLGRKHDREWTYAGLGGLAHLPDVPITLLFTRDGASVAGLRVPRGAAAGFRLRLTLAYADAIGEREAVLTRLDEAVAAHRRSRPAAPVVATAEQAPPSARLARSALAAAGVALIALAAFAATAGPGGRDHPRTAFPTGDGGVIAVPATTTPGVVTDIGAPASSAATGSPTPGTATPGTAEPGMAGGAPIRRPLGPYMPLPDPPTRRVPPATRPAAPVPTPAPVDPAPVPTPSTTPPTATPTDRCGAPENPYGYTYCGGSRIQDPAPDVCSYFACVAGFWQGEGYMIQCGDGTVGMVGGRNGTCPERQGRKQPVYAPK